MSADTNRAMNIQKALDAILIELRGIRTQLRKSPDTPMQASETSWAAPVSNVRWSSMNDLELIRSHLSGISISDLPALAERSQVPFGTLHKIKYGKTKNPRFETVKALTEYFRSHAQ